MIKTLIILFSLLFSASSFVGTYEAYDAGDWPYDELVVTFIGLERAGNLRVAKDKKEHPTALISAASGEIDIRNWQSPKPLNNSKEVAA